MTDTRKLSDHQHMKAWLCSVPGCQETCDDGKRLCFKCSPEFIEWLGEKADELRNNGSTSRAKALAALRRFVEFKKVQPVER